MNGIRRSSAFPCTGVSRVSRTTDILTCRDEGLSWWTARLMGGEVKLMGGEAKLMGGEAKLMGGEAKLVGDEAKLVGDEAKLVGGEAKLKATGHY